VENLSEYSRIGDPTMKAGMHRETVRGYVVAGKPPSEVTVVRRMADAAGPLKVLAEIKAQLRDTPKLRLASRFPVVSRRSEVIRMADEKTVGVSRGPELVGLRNPAESLHTTSHHRRAPTCTLLHFQPPRNPEDHWAEIPLPRLTSRLRGPLGVVRSWIDRDVVVNFRGSFCSARSAPPTNRA
jgi:hypothetical protein